jgi:hypothetical protein
LGVGQIRFGPGFFEGAQWFIAGWSSPVARQAHNLKVTGSNPVPATKFDAVVAAEKIKGRPFGAAFCLSEMSAEARFR